MDTRAPAGSVPSDEGGSWSPSGRSEDALERRLAALEARLDDLDEAIRDAVPVATRNAVEAACRDVVPSLCRTAVHEELQGVGEDLRRAIAELGRLLLRDLDRLTKVLADHRDTIVDRLIGPEEEPPPVGGDDEGPANDDALDLGLPPEERPGAGEEPTRGEEGSWRVLPGRLRRRARRR